MHDTSLTIDGQSLRLKASIPSRLNSLYLYGRLPLIAGRAQGPGAESRQGCRLQEGGQEIGGGMEGRRVGSFAD